MIAGNEEKGFTLVELIVAMVVIGILVLLAVPMFFGHRERARIAHITHDVRVVEDKMGELILGDDGVHLMHSWGIVDTDTLSNDDLYNTGGLLVDRLLNDYRVIPEEYVKSEVKGHLGGTFYTDNDGRVLYSESKHDGVTEDILSDLSDYVDENYPHDNYQIVALTADSPDTYGTGIFNHNDTITNSMFFEQPSGEVSDYAVGHKHGVVGQSLRHIYEGYYPMGTHTYLFSEHLDRLLSDHDAHPYLNVAVPQYNPTSFPKPTFVKGLETNNGQTSQSYYIPTPDQIGEYHDLIYDTNDNFIYDLSKPKKARQIIQISEYGSSGDSDNMFIVPLGAGFSTDILEQLVRNGGVQSVSPNIANNLYNMAEYVDIMNIATINGEEYVIIHTSEQIETYMVDGYLYAVFFRGPFGYPAQIY